MAELRHGFRGHELTSGRESSHDFHVKRIFLGWQQSMAESATEWLWERCGEISTMCIVVPTSQAGRRLREALSVRAQKDDTVVMGLNIVTPAYFLRIDDPATAAEEIELVAWIEVLEQVRDWQPLGGAFPIAPGIGDPPGWSISLAQSLVALRRSLQESGLLISDAARLMAGGEDGGRWSALALLEAKVEKLLSEWSLQSKSSSLRKLRLSQSCVPLPPGCRQLVVAGVTDCAGVVAGQWQAHAGTTVLMGAPESELENFDQFGRPLVSWNDRPLGIPGHEGISGEVAIATDSRQLARQAVSMAAAAGLASDQIMLATCDPALGRDLVAAFAHAGWAVHDPAATSLRIDWRSWLGHWRSWLVTPRLAVLVEIAAFPETTALTGIDPLSWSVALGELRDRFLVDSLEDVERIATQAALRPPQGTDDLIAVVRNLLAWRERFLVDGFSAAMGDLAARWCEQKVIDDEVRAMIEQQSSVWNVIMPMVKRDSGFWLELFGNFTPAAAQEIPVDRALDVEGWLEIPFNSSPHLLICGMHDGVVPARGGGEPWLVEGARKILGVATDEQRSARDAFLYHAALASRRAAGRIDIIFAKTDGTGKILRPSRLLLKAGGRELAERVIGLFCEMEPVDSQLVWTQDWSWQPRLAEMAVARLSVTAFRDYLSCPYRFYLKHVLKMSERDGGRGEWNSRDFGTIMHEVLEQWGRDPAARDAQSAKDISAWLIDRLAWLVERWYGSHPGLAVEIQHAALRQRFHWFAEIQAERRKAGWLIHAVEQAFQLPMEKFTVSGKVDRIDHHPDTGEWMMWDYKSGANEDGVVKSHLKNTNARTVWPVHLGDDSRLRLAGEKNKIMRWINLQLPLYAAAGLTPSFAGVGYIAMGDSADKVKFDAWKNFDPDLVEAAKNCAELLIERIGQNVFWPPAESPEFDDYRALAAGADLAVMTESPFFGESGIV